MGGPLLGPPVVVPSLVQIVWKLKNFSLLLWRRHCVASLPHPGCLLPPWARPYAAFSRPVLPCSQRPKIWLYRDMKLPQLGSVVLWLRIFTQLWNLQDIFKTIWKLDLNSIWEYGGVWEAPRSGDISRHRKFPKSWTSARHDMQNIIRATLHKSWDICTIFLIHNYEGLSNVSLVL